MSGTGTPTGPLSGSGSGSISEQIADQELRGLHDRIHAGEVHGNLLAEATGRGRPGAGLISGTTLAGLSVVAAFVAGMAGAVITHQREEIRKTEKAPSVSAPHHPASKDG
ncbi:hypothetical protein [Streptomyces sp. NPDC051776]|uniref:hypothetical protein n=1 Tax=Streptomyces sp. NPDC051776 TaxID=3155414 RepID=UPI0034438BE2